MTMMIDGDRLIEWIHDLCLKGRMLTEPDIRFILNELSRNTNGFANGWISVKDRLPDAAGYECLVCAVNEIYNQVHVFTAHTGYGEPGWWTGNVHYMARVKSPSDNRVHHALRITHWMPLPEPPKEKSCNDNG